MTEGPLIFPASDSESPSERIGFCVNRLACNKLTVAVFGKLWSYGNAVIAVPARLACWIRIARRLLVLQDLLVGAEALLQLAYIKIREGFTFIDGLAGSGGGGLS